MQISMSLPEDRVRLAEEKMQKLIDRKQQEAVLEKAVVDAEGTLEDMIFLE